LTPLPEQDRVRLQKSNDYRNILQRFIWYKICEKYLNFNQIRNYSGTKTRGMKKEPKADSLSGPGAKPLILLFLLLSGSCGLVYEILWLKMLTLVIGNTVFAVTTVLTAFMGGLALGSYLAGRYSDKIENPLRTYGILEGGIGLYALLLPLLIAGTEPLFRLVYQASILLFIPSACCAFSSAASCCWFPAP